jgi:hypothetical protein
VTSPRAVLAAVLAAVGTAGTALMLAWCYHRLSWTVPATSDGAFAALQAQDMLHGNWLLHGWTVGDVSFYTTELPEYVVIEWFRGLGPGVVHIAAAVTYTLLVLLAGLLARGHSHGREGLLRALVAAGIMLAPQLGFGAFVLLLSPDHTGTGVPLLLAWVLLDLAPRRWWVPVLIGVLLACAQFADRVAVLTAVLPLLIVCCAVAARSAPRDGRGIWRACWFEISLAAAAVASVVVAFAAARLMSAAGGFTAHPINYTLAPLRLLWTHTWLTGWGILELYGANFIGVSGWPGWLFMVAHLAGLALAAAAFAVALGRFLRLRADADRVLVESVLAVAIAVNLASYAVSIEPGPWRGTGYDAREIAAVLPCGAVLAGRLFGPWLAGRARETPVRPVRLPRLPRLALLVRLALGAVALCYLAALGYGAAQPAVPPRNAALARWLTVHHFRYGLAEAASNVTTLDSGGRVRLAVTHVSGAPGAPGARVRALLYESQASAYDPRLHDANFLVTSAPAEGGTGYGPETIPYQVVSRTFGPPARVYHFAGYTIMVWDVNLLTLLRLTTA